MHPLVELAKSSIENYVRSKKTIAPPFPLTDEMSAPAGTFVSLKKGGVLRGCIGTFSPSYSTAAEEIIHNAISAAIMDPRFPPVEEIELTEIKISVDLLTPPEPVSDDSTLDPKKYGIIVTQGIKRGLLLPDIEGVDSVSEQLLIAKRKAGIRSDEKCRLQRFTVKRYH